MQKIGYKLVIGAFALVLVGAGCSSTSSTGTEVGMKTDTGSSVQTGKCGPLKVTVGGQDVSGKYTNALAYTMVNGEYRTEMVSLFNGEKFHYTCEDILGQGKIDSNDLDMVGASYSDISYAQGVNFGADNYSTKTSLETAGSGVGSTQTICATPVSWKGMTTVPVGTDVSVSGALSGTYCGEKKM